MALSRGERWTVVGGIATLVSTIIGGVVLLYGDELACKTGSSSPFCDSGGTTSTVRNDPFPDQVEPPADQQPESEQRTAAEPVVMTVDPPVCSVKGIDLDAFQEGDLPDDAEFVMGDESCVRGSGEAYLSAVADAPLTHISSTPGPIPTMAECEQGLRNARTDDIRGMSAAGGTLCFLTTEGRVAGVSLSSTQDQVLTLRISLWQVD